MRLLYRPAAPAFSRQRSRRFDKRTFESVSVAPPQLAIVRWIDARTSDTLELPPLRVRRSRRLTRADCASPHASVTALAWSPTSSDRARPWRIPWTAASRLGWKGRFVTSSYRATLLTRSAPTAAAKSLSAFANFARVFSRSAARMGLEA